MIEIRSFQEGDFERLMPHVRPVFREEFHGMQVHVPEHIEDKLTFECGSEVIAVLAGYKPSHGVYEVFALISEATSRMPLEFHKKVLGLMDRWYHDRNVHRIQMSVRLGSEQEERWAKSLGFKREGLMRKYGPDRTDYWLYGRTV